MWRHTMAILLAFGGFLLCVAGFGCDVLRNFFFFFIYLFIYLSIFVALLFTLFFYLSFSISFIMEFLMVVCLLE